MADEEIKNDVENADVTSDTEVKSDGVIDPSVSVEAEKEVIENLNKEKKKEGAEATDGPSKGILSRIGNMLKGKGDIDDTKVDVTEGEDIPDDFTNAAREAGWSDEDITEFASDYDDKQLNEMIAYLKDEEAIENKTDNKTKVEDKTKDKVDIKVETKDDKKKGEDKEESSEIKALRERIDTLEKAQKKVKEAFQEDEKNSMADYAEEFFDEISEFFEVFGKAKDMPKFPNGKLIPTSPAYKARAEVLGYALSFYAGGQSWDTALENAFATYSGKNLEKDVERNLIKKMKDNSEKLSPDRYNKITEKTYTDETEREADVVRKAQQDAGVKVD